VKTYLWGGCEAGGGREAVAGGWGHALALPVKFVGLPLAIVSEGGNSARGCLAMAMRLQAHCTTITPTHFDPSANFIMPAPCMSSFSHSPSYLPRRLSATVVQ
jgi:hypothetical protein